MRQRGSVQDGKTKQKWYEWLEKKKREDEKNKMEDMHQQKVTQMIKSAEGRAGLLHKITKPTAWRGGAQILKTEEEELDRCEAKRKEWAKQKQCTEDVQNLEDKHWENKELKELEEALPRLTSVSGKKCRNYTRQRRVGFDGFHSKFHLGIDTRNEGNIVEFLEKVEQSGKWPQQTCTTMFFLIPKDVTSERPIALMPTLIRWWEALTALEVAKWQQKILWIGTLLTGEMEEPSKQCGKFCWRWKGLMVKQGKKIKEPWLWSWTWRRPSSGSVFLWCGPGQR